MGTWVRKSREFASIDPSSARSIVADIAYFRTGHQVVGASDRSAGALVLDGAARNSIVAALHGVGTARIAPVDAFAGSVEPLVVVDRSFVRPVIARNSIGRALVAAVDARIRIDHALLQSGRGRRDADRGFGLD